jgi:D-3-phosphoglycerate dehydrogenase
MGDHDVNIAAMFNAREAIGGEALTIYNVDQEVPKAARRELESDGRVLESTYISLNG